jgi:hypothetical protein
MLASRFLAPLCALLAGLALAFTPQVAAAKGQSPAQVTAPPAVTVINGNPLQIHVGDDASFQVFNSDVPGSGQVYPTDATDTADMGWFVDAGGTLFAPNFDEHPAGSATSGIGTYTPFTPGTLSGVSGSGSAADPFRVTVTGTLAGSGLGATLQVSYVNGDNYFTKVFTLSNSGSAAAPVKIFLGADIYLASSDAGVPFREPNSGSPGGQDCGSPPTYTILLIPQSAPDAWSARGYSTVWSEIGARQLSSSADAGCLDNGAGLQWNRTVPAGGAVSVQAATSFGEIPAITQFVVSNVNPSSGSPGSNVDVTITGIGFIDGTTFDFGAGISVTNLVLVDTSTATATLVIDASAIPGPRDVVGTQGSGGDTGGALTSTLVNGFTVLGGPPPPGGGSTVSAPTLGTWGLIALLLAMLVVGMRARPHRKG